MSNFFHGCLTAIIIIGILLWIMIDSISSLIIIGIFIVFSIILIIIGPKYKANYNNYYKLHDDTFISGTLTMQD